MLTDTQLSENLSNTEENTSDQEKVGLSSRPNLTASIHIKKYINGEGTGRIVTRGTNLLIFKPPINVGERVCNGLSRRGKRRIKQACRIFQFLTKLSKQTCAMITLTYGNDFPSDKIAKKHLDNFFKRLRRYKSVNRYLWVAERQKRGAIHFHILTDYTDKEFINEAWNMVVNKWQFESKLPLQTLYPHVFQVNFPANYLSKYISKGGQSIKGNLYGMSQCLSMHLNPILEYSVNIDPELFEVILEETKKALKIKFNRIADKAEITRFIWAKEGIDEIATKIKQLTEKIQHD